MADKKLKGYVAQRENAILRLKEIRNIADEALKNSGLHSGFKVRYKHLLPLVAEFNNHHTAILNIVAAAEDPDMQEQQDIRKSFDNDFYAIETIYADLFDTNKGTANVVAPSHVRLPKLELKKFNGSINSWKTFIDLYNSMIHNNSSLSNVEKFTYLLNSLEGPPLTIVQCNPLTDGNYLIAYNALIDRYENSRLISVSHWRALEKSKKIVSECDVKSLQCLLDTFTEHLAALKHLNYPVKEWDFILFYMLFDRLDTPTATRFELECGKSLDEFNNRGNQYGILLNFLRRQCIALDTVSNSVSLKSPEKEKPSYKGQKRAFFVKNETLCSSCNTKGHLIYSCPEFLRRNSEERYNFVKTHNWCTNCLGTRHTSFKCSSRVRCAKCSKPHHTLLHHDRSRPLPGSTGCVSSDAPLSTGGCGAAAQSVALANLKPIAGLRDETVLLATAQIRVLDSRGIYQSARVLLDSASQVNFITTRCCNRLGLKKRPFSLSVKGLGDMISDISRETTCTFVPKTSNQPQITLSFAVMHQICGNMPPSSLPDDSFAKFSHLSLADDKFNISAPIDMLLGCDVFGFLFKGGSISGSVDEPVAIDTSLGWIIMGRVPLTPLVASRNALLCSAVSVSLDETVKAFWQLEQVPQAVSLSPEEVAAERMFSDTLSRDHSGRYVVRFPFRNSDVPQFRGSRDIALRRFYSLERRLLADPALYDEYRRFMHDYLGSGHMGPAQPMQCSESQYYIPHHCVVRPGSSTTKLRVVFDASAKSSNGVSLNDTLLIGPKLQQDIFNLLLRFRTHAIVFTADIKQMYRQIIMSESHRDFQRIVWRFSKCDPIQDYRLNTVTYGVSSSPFQAIRTLIQLAQDYRSQFPRAAEVLEREIYVDDVLSGADDVGSALSLQRELIELFALGGFELRKWASNHPLLLSHLDGSLSQLDPLSLDGETECSVKILGLQWNPSTDAFVYHVVSAHVGCTKRGVLSDLSRIFDPLGFLAPGTVWIKILVQELWSLGLGWDEPAPEAIAAGWALFKDGLSSLSTLALPRGIVPKGMKFCELHGFCDSSEKAYAAVVYLRTITDSGAVHLSFLCAKTRVAPLKRISIPRLELCAAVLLSDLLSAVESVYRDLLRVSSVFAYTDSTVALSWIRSSPHKWTTFVSNRITYVQERLSSSQWSHVASERNPADWASRGMVEPDAPRLQKWWAGPSFLTSHCGPWCGQSFEDVDVEIEKRKVALTVVSSTPVFWEILIERFSSLSKINRVFAYLLRFVSHVREPGSVSRGPISSEELDGALLILIRQVQSVSFPREIAELSGAVPNLKSLPRGLRKLSPFLDPGGFLRVGGRLSRSALAYEHKHPYLLPSDHRLTRLIVKFTHEKYLHPGHQTTRHLISQRYYIPSFGRVVRGVLSSCVRCFRCNPTAQVPMMADLPAARVNQVKSFTKCGVDFGGPFFVTMGRLRGARTYRAYLCLFVCLATKALHLELASDLSSDCFLAALRRFLSRRGPATDIYSDCGTNFVGASKQLVKCMRDACDGEGIRWHFNPPAAPNFGGIWEAGIKSVKSHIARVVGSHILTYEEFSTVLTSIEAVLNSRPLCSLSTDPNDLGVLTPAHFLTLRPLGSFVEPDTTNVNLGRLSRWQLLQRMHQDFWKRWHTEYLHTLNQRSKWYDPSVSIRIDTLVLLKDELCPPLAWRMGRVIDVHPGADGVVRVVTVKTQKGVIKRPVSKICPLPEC